MMKTLLIVDDDIAIVKQIAFALSQKYRIFEALSIEEALHIIDTETIDIALVDLGLPPHENDYTYGNIVITKLLETTNAKVIVLTGQSDESYPKELIQKGVFDYIHKPVDMSFLASAIDRASFFLENELLSENEIKLSFSTSLQDGLKASSEEAQRQLLLKVLKQTGFNISKTAKLLNISRENCYYFLKKFHIERPSDV